jgi:uncharacterized protein (DUF433 family)
MKRQTQAKAAHAHIDKRRGYRGGRAIIAGTNFPVSSVVMYILRHGMSGEELVRMFPHLTLAQVYDALSYYYDHQSEIDAEIERNMSEDSFASKLPSREILRFRFDVKKDEFVVSSIG